MLATRELIKNEFLNIYKVKPLHKISVSDLSKACNLSRGTFYFYFEDVYALYRVCEKSVIDRMEKEFPEVVLCIVGVDFNRFVKVFGKLLHGIINYIDTFKCLLNGSEEASFRKALFESFRCHYELSIHFSSVVSPTHSDYLTRFFAGGLQSIISYWVLTGCTDKLECEVQAEEIAYIAAQVLFKGAFIPKYINSAEVSQRPATNKQHAK